jgi:hypothetical protein
MNTDGCVKYINFDDQGYAPIDDLIDIFTRAHQKATILQYSVMSEHSPNSSLLAGNETIVEAGDYERAVRKLDALRSKMPVYLAVKARYRVRDQDEPPPGQPAPHRVDWTDRSDAMQFTSHALLLTGYDKSRRIVSYKDPNYGDIEIRITASQFIEMAGDAEYNDKLRMRPYDASQGRLRELGD